MVLAKMSWIDGAALENELAALRNQIKVLKVHIALALREWEREVPHLIQDRPSGVYLFSHGRFVDLRHPRLHQVQLEQVWNKVQDAGVFVVL